MARLDQHTEQWGRERGEGGEARTRPVAGDPVTHHKNNPWLVLVGWSNLHTTSCTLWYAAGGGHTPALVPRLPLHFVCVSANMCLFACARVQQGPLPALHNCHHNMSMASASVHLLTIPPLSHLELEDLFEGVAMFDDAEWAFTAAQLEEAEDNFDLALRPPLTQPVPVAVCLPGGTRLRLRVYSFTGCCFAEWRRSDPRCGREPVIPRPRRHLATPIRCALAWAAWPRGRAPHALQKARPCQVFCH